MSQSIEAIVNKPFVKYDAATVEVPYLTEDADRILIVEFLFNTIQEPAVNDNCTKVQYGCEQSLNSSEVDTFELEWRNCLGVDILSSNPTVVDNKVVNTEFTTTFVQLQLTNYFRLWGVKSGAKFLVSKGVLYART